MRAQLSNRDYEHISAYLDGQLAPGDRKKLEERMRSRPELQQALEEMTRTRALLRAAPRRRAPRNFTLTPAMVGEHKKARGANWFSGLFPTLSFASAVATLALILSLAFELLPIQQPAMTAQSQPDTVAMQPYDGEDASRMMEAPQEEPAMEAAPGEAAPMEAAPAAEPEMGMAQEQAAPSDNADPKMEAPSIAGEPAPEMKAMPEAAPPIINFGDPAAQGVPPGMGGGGGAYAAPPSMWGMGGGAPDPYMDQKGLSGQLTLPLESVESLNPDDFQQRNPARMLEQPESEITGSGPILGVPAPDEEGKIQIQSSWGQPVEIITGPAAEARENAGESSPAAATVGQPELFGLPALRVVQGLLALLAVGLGAAAVIVRRRLNSR